MHLSAFTALVYILLTCHSSSARLNKHAKRQTFPHALVQIPAVDNLLEAALPLKLNSNGASGLFKLELGHRNKVTNLDGLSKLASNGRLRAAVNFALGTGGQSSGSSSSLSNEQNSFVATVTVSSGKSYDLIVDTGSSNTWIGADSAKPYTAGPKAKNTGNKFDVAYGSGEVNGNQYIDTITIGQLKIANQGVGAASTSAKFSGVDGVLGLGPTGLSVGTLSPNSSATIPTVVDNALKQRLITSAVLGVYFPPGAGTDKGPAGEMTIGGVDASRMTSKPFYVPITSTAPASRYWGVSATITSGTTAILPNSAGVVDTGTTMILFATDAFKKYAAQIPNAAVDSASSFLRFPKSSLNKVPNITVKLSSGSLVLKRYAQLVPPSVYSEFGLDSAYYYSWVGDLGSNSGAGLDFILGQKFLERFYSIYDTPNKRVGFALTAYSNPTGF